MEAVNYLVQVYNPSYAQPVYNAYATQELAQEAAEAAAHRTQGSVLIFKAVTKVAPKRDVVVTDLTTEE